MKKILLVLIIVLVTVSCDDSQKSNNENEVSGKLEVFVVNYPLYYFTEIIGGAHVDILFPIPAYVDPTLWVPNEELEEIQKVDLILSNGAGYAKWIEKVSLPVSKIINTTGEISNTYIEQKQTKTHSHGSEGEHVHDDFEYTTWLDFNIAIVQAASVKKALSELRPGLKEEFEENFRVLKKELLGFNEKMIQLGKKLNGRTLFASHPVYQYMARAYDLDIISMHWEPDELLTEKDWLSFKQELENQPSDIMLWEKEPGNEIRLILNELGLKTVVFNPAGNNSENIDFSILMEQNMLALENYITSKPN